MVADRNLARVVRSWLRTDEHESADRVLETVLDLLDATPQRRPSWPARRIADMNTLTRVAVAAAAVVLVAIAGFKLLPLPTGPATTPGPTPEPTPRLYYWPANLEPGTYATSFIWNVPLAVTFTVPEGWESRDIELIRKGHVSLSVTAVEDVARTVCESGFQDPRVGQSVEDLAAAIGAIDGIEVAEAVVTELGGVPAISLGYSVPSDLPCAEEDAVLWTLPEGLVADVAPVGPLAWPARAGSSSVWLVEVNGVRLAIVATSSPDATTDETFELQGIVDSLRFELPREAGSRGTCGVQVQLSGVGTATPPYVTALGTAGMPSELRGPIPSPLPVREPLARLDFLSQGGGDGPPAGDRPGLLLVPPLDAEVTGFSTSMTVNGFQGSALFDGPGTWWVVIGSSSGGCATWFPVEVQPPGD